MCGIYGVFSRYKSGLSASDIGLAKQMAIITSLRGDHSSGIAVARRDLKEKPWIARVIGDPFNLFLRKTFLDDFDALMKGSQGSMGFFGHGRYATRGKITTENAHPFSEEHITLVHNGTINSGVDMTAKTSEGNTVEVDSHALALSMSTIGIGKALAKVNGAYAIIAHNQDDGCFYFAHNKERPLHYFQSHSKLIVMSEWDMLSLLINRNVGFGTATKADYEKGLFTVHEFETEKLYKFDTTTLNLSIVEDLKETRQALAPASVTPFRNKTDIRSGSVSGHRGGTTTTDFVTFMCTGVTANTNNRDYTYQLELQDGAKAISITATKDETLVGRIGTAPKVIVERRKGVVKQRQIKFKTIDWYPLVDPVGPFLAAANDGSVEDDELTVEQSINGVYLARKRFDDLAKHGCALCQGDVHFDEVDKTYVLGQDQGVVCYDCVKSDMLAGYGIHFRSH